MPRHLFAYLNGDGRQWRRRPVARGQCVRGQECNGDTQPMRRHLLSLNDGLECGDDVCGGEWYRKCVPGKTVTGDDSTCNVILCEV